MIEQIALACGKAKKTSSGWQCCCPAHEDRSPSLSLAESDDKILYHCKAGCSQESVRSAIEALGFHLNGSFGAIPETKIYYTYYNEAGKPVHRKEKFLPSKKMFIQHYLNGEWHYKIGPNPPILYNLASLRAAIKAGLPVAIAEGEKDCDRASSELGLVCTCNISGATQAGRSEKQWPKSFTNEFVGANVFIFYDNDGPGIKHLEFLTNEIKSVASKLTIIHCKSKDLSEHFDAGYTKDDLMAENIPLPAPLRLDGGEWLENSTYEFDPCVENLFDAGDKVAIIGKSKTRKSFFAMQLLLSAVTGEPLLGFNIPKVRKAILIQYEIKESHFHKRLERTCDALGILPNRLKGRLSIINARGVDLTREQIGKEIKESGAEIVLFDPIYKLMTEGENAVEDFKPLFQWFDRIAKESGAAIIYVHHDRKGFTGDQDLSDRGAGSSIVGRDFDAAFFLTPHENEELVVLETLTRNYAPNEKQSLQWLNNSFVQSEEAPRVKTSRSKDTRNKTKLEDWIEPAKLILQKNGPMSVIQFEEELKDLGSSVRQARAIRELLVQLLTAKIETFKAGKGFSSKQISLVIKS